MILPYSGPRFKKGFQPPRFRSLMVLLLRVQCLYSTGATSPLAREPHLTDLLRLMLVFFVDLLQTPSYVTGSKGLLSPRLTPLGWSQDELLPFDPPRLFPLEILRGGGFVSTQVFLGVSPPPLPVPRLPSELCDSFADDLRPGD